MGHATESTLWPSALIPSKVKQLIDHFFSLVDDQDVDAGGRLATEAFTKDGKFFAASGSFEGTEEITRSRKTVWDLVVSRRHRVEKVYVNDVEGLDLVVVGSVAVEPRSGEPKSHQFLARILLENCGPADVPRMKHYEVLISGKDSILSTASRN